MQATGKRLTLLTGSRETEVAPAFSRKKTDTSFHRRDGYPERISCYMEYSDIRPGKTWGSWGRRIQRGLSGENWGPSKFHSLNTAYVFCLY